MIRAVLARYLAVAVVAVAAIVVSADPPYSNGPPIRSDGVGYHAWTRAISEHNPHFCQWQALRDVQAISAERDGICQNKYPPGLALLRFPVMVWFVDHDARDLGITEGEHEASLWLGALALVIALALAAATAGRLGARPLAINVAVLAVAFGTGLFHYATYDGSFTHVYSAALLAALVFVGVRAARLDRPLEAVAVAVLTALTGLVRLPNLALVLVLLCAWLLWRVRPLPAAERRRAALKALIPVGAGALVAVAWQVAYNRYATGTWTLNSYGQEPFDLGLLKEPQVLFSYERGVFVWYPLLAAVLIGAALLRATRGWALTLAAAIAVLTLVYGSWHSWFLGGGFGHRGFVELAPLAAVAGAVALQAAGRRQRALMAAVMLVCCFATFELMVGYWNGSISFDGTTGKQYWSHILGEHSLLF